MSKVKLAAVVILLSAANAAPLFAADMINEKNLSRGKTKVVRETYRQPMICGDLRVNYRTTGRTQDLTLCAPPSAFDRNPPYYTYLGWRE